LTRQQPQQPSSVEYLQRERFSSLDFLRQRHQQ
jgi:hypothetical protein